MTDTYKYLRPSERRERELSDRYSHLMAAIESEVNAIAPDAVVIAEETLSGHQFLALDVAALLRLLAAVHATDLDGTVCILEQGRS